MSDAARCSTIPIIATTAEPESSELLQQARSLGIAAIIKKPWKPQELAGVLQSAWTAGTHSSTTRPKGEL
jgi:CheY-like chemotaxis protein